MKDTAMKLSNQTPTQVVSEAFTLAYNHFNSSLFNGKLPSCIIHMHRKAKCYGYFAGNRFGSSTTASITVDEIALNPSSFKERSLEQTLSTLVHEMVHLWQHHFGEKKAKGYHNKEWVEHMKDKGLCPSSTGAPGGKETGQSVSHYIIEGGDFAVSCAELIAEGFALPYVELWTTDKAKAAKKAASKTKYTCPGCGMNAWAKEGVSMSCNECLTVLESQ